MNNHGRKAVVSFKLQAERLVRAMRGLPFIQRPYGRGFLVGNKKILQKED